MKKIILTTMIVLGLIVLVSAAAFNLQEKTYPAEEPKEPIIYDVITFDGCGENYEVNSTEPNGWEEDDILRLVRRHCNDTISNIRKDGDLWQSDEEGNNIGFYDDKGEIVK